ncbi:hypothetical protein BDY19DRAFT_894139 [Irpex rosettiformis]|uniref:Uncharacterized protein n=1 Tax=Irpex rosettiformis TaxID=378272 RepID=A0ACB8TXZ4_9APHY|nr:hypothetical protein BDY19DRAFT_894139 [Irpex rosettiformis]
MRRKTSQPFADSVNLTVHEPSFKPTPSPTPSIKSTSTFRHRLSSFSFLSSKRSSKASATKSGGICYNAQYRATDSFSRSDTPSPTPSLEEIRRPSGLGRRVSITAQPLEQGIKNRSTPNALSPHVPRKASVSAPNLPLLPEGFVRWEVSEPEEETEDGHVYEPVCMFMKIPPNLLNAVFGFVPPPDLTSLARVCKSFLSPSRALLYGNVDLLPITDQRRIDVCLHTLASKQNLAKLVRRFACSSILETRPALLASPLPTSSLAIALNNMTELVSLKVPRFDPNSFFHTSFQLRSLTLLWETATSDDLQGMFAWLTTQPTLTSLSFPNLILDERTSDILSGAGNALSEPTSDEPHQLDSSTSLLSFPFVSQLVPDLTRLHAPSSIVAALAPGRPLTFITMHLHSTIYNGLRPSALLSTISQATTPLTHLAITTSPRSAVDPRTLERVLMAAGAELGKNLKTLEIESTLEDEVLFKQLHIVLVRYHALHTLRLWRAAENDSGMYLTPPPTPSVIPTTPITPTTPSIPFRPRPNTAAPLRTQERALLGQWVKQCNTLRNVIFPSGHRWRITDDVGGPIFTLLGSVST